MADWAAFQLSGNNLHVCACHEHFKNLMQVSHKPIRVPLAMPTICKLHTLRALHKPCTPIAQACVQRCRDI